jgi:hypothetical protein
MRLLQAVAEQWARAIVQGGLALSSFVAHQIRQIARLCKKHRQKTKPTIETRLQACSPATKIGPTPNPVPQIALA